MKGIGKLAELKLEMVSQFFHVHYSTALAHKGWTMRRSAETLIPLIVGEVWKAARKDKKHRPHCGKELK